MDPKDDTQTSGGLSGSQVTPMADKTIPVADESTQVNPDVPQATEPVQPKPMASAPKVAPIPNATQTTPVSSGVTVGQPVGPAEPAGIGTTTSGLTQEEPVSTTPDTPMVGSETEETGTTTGSVAEPMEGTSTDDTNTSGGGVSNL